MNETKQIKFIVTENAVINLNRLLAYAQHEAIYILHFDDGTRIRVSREIGNAIVEAFRELTV